MINYIHSNDNDGEDLDDAGLRMMMMLLKVVTMIKCSFLCGSGDE